jgi:hypothetical protein
MSNRASKIVFALSLAATLSACGPPDTIYTQPGWYLEKPRQLFAWGPRLFKGPMTYEACEVERKALPVSTADNMLCIKEFGTPGPYGPYQ